MKTKRHQPTVVVTGVSSGIGNALAKYLVAKGFFVFGSIRRAKDAQELCDTLTSDFHPLIFDVCNPHDIRASAKTVLDYLDGQALHGLVNNAGLAAFGPMECLDDDSFEASIAVNLMGTRNVTNAFIPLLRATAKSGPGKIVNISSLSGILNTPMNGAYCVSKHAMESLGEIYRRELLPAEIDVVSIRSGPIQSEIWAKSKQDNPDVYENADYQQMAHKARRIMHHAEKHALPASAIAEIVCEVFLGKKSRTAYHLSQGAWMSRILATLPDRWADRLITGALMKQKTNRGKV